MGSRERAGRAGFRPNLVNAFPSLPRSFQTDAFTLVEQGFHKMKIECGQPQPGAPAGSTQNPFHEYFEQDSHGMDAWDYIEKHYGTPSLTEQGRIEQCHKEQTTEDWEKGVDPLDELLVKYPENDSHGLGTQDYAEYCQIT